VYSEARHVAPAGPERYASGEPVRDQRGTFRRLRSVFTVAVVAGGLMATGAVADRLAAPAWSAMRAQEPVVRIEACAGQGATLAILGGFRALVADVTWIRLYALWETSDLPAVDTLVRLVPSIDPRPEYFWLNGARIIAHDFLAWRIEAAGGYGSVGEAEQARLTREQARQALAHLENAMRFHPHSAELWIERANLELNALHDVAAAAASYRRAAERPGAPYYAARLHAEMLRRLGRDADALAWLVQLHPRLPRDDEAAAADLVLERIRILERRLAVTAEHAFRPPP
jgi:tetratricopeptide (TPR) repeat protein